MRIVARVSQTVLPLFLRVIRWARRLCVRVWLPLPGMNRVVFLLFLCILFYLFMVKVRRLPHCLVLSQFRYQIDFTRKTFT